MKPQEAHDAIERSKQEQSNKENVNSVPAWIIILEAQLAKAKKEWYEGGENAIKKISNLGGCVLTCLEQCGEGEPEAPRGDSDL